MWVLLVLPTHSTSSLLAIIKNLEHASSAFRQSRIGVRHWKLPRKQWRADAAAAAAPLHALNRFSRLLTFRDRSGTSKINHHQLPGVRRERRTDDPGLSTRHLSGYGLGMHTRAYICTFSPSWSTKSAQQPLQLTQAFRVQSLSKSPACVTSVCSILTPSTL